MTRLKIIASVSLLGLWAASTAYAQEVERLRLSKNADFDRIVLDLGLDYVDAEQSTNNDEFVVELSAPKPELSLPDEDRLADLRVYFERAPGGGSRLVVDRAGRKVRVFRLEGDRRERKGDRIVLDVGRRGGGPLTIPGDAGVIPERGGSAERVARRPEPTPTPEPPRRAEPPRRERTPEPEVTRASPPKIGFDDNYTPGEEAPPDEDVWVLVRAIEIEGVKNSPSLDELRDLKLAVSPFADGYVAPRADRPVQRIPLGGLTGDDRNGRRLSGSVLQLIVETIAAAYARNEKLGTKVDIRRTDLDQLFEPDSDGRLVIRVRESNDRSASR